MSSSRITLPRLIDCHVHFREPGLTHKADMQTEAVAAWAGGVGTVCEMPNTLPPTVTLAALADKIRRTESLKTQDTRHNVDIRFFFGATEIAHVQALRELLTGTSEEVQRLRKYCCGLKLYFDHSTGNQKASDEVIEEAFKLCSEQKFPIVAHCEDAETNATANRLHQSGEPRHSGVSSDVSIHSLVRPPESEVIAIEKAIGLVRKFGGPFHVAHLSTKRGLDLVRSAKKEGLPITCEVAPHHLFLTTDDYKTLGALAKMNPPLRTKEHQEALWAGIADGTVDCIATDHAPHSLEEKLGTAESPRSPLDAPSGVPGVETMLPLLLTVVSGHWPNPRAESRVQRVELKVEDVSRLCFENPNHIFNLGKDASDTIEVDLGAEWTISAKELHFKCGWSPYEGWRVRGKIIT